MPFCHSPVTPVTPSTECPLPCTWAFCHSAGLVGENSPVITRRHLRFNECHAVAK